MNDTINLDTNPIGINIIIIGAINSGVKNVTEIQRWCRFTVFVNRLSDWWMWFVLSVACKNVVWLFACTLFVAFLNSDFSALVSGESCKWYEARKYISLLLSLVESLYSHTSAEPQNVIKFTCDAVSHTKLQFFCTMCVVGYAEIPTNEYRRRFRIASHGASWKAIMPNWNATLSS